MAEVLRTNTADHAAAPDPRDEVVRDVLLSVLRSLVDDSDKVDVVCVAAEGGMTFQVYSDASGAGKLIGRGGRTARSIRILLSGISAKNGRRYTLDILRA